MTPSRRTAKACDARRTAKACDALEPLGFEQTLVKTTLKKLLELYDGHWELIEDDNYHVLLEELINASDQEKLTKGVKSSKKHAPLRIELPAANPIPKRLRTRRIRGKGKAPLVEEPQHGEKKVVPLCSESHSSSEEEELQPLLKRSRTRLREEASRHCYNCQTEVAKTSLTRDRQGDVGCSASLGTKTDSKDYETQLEKMSQQSKKDLATCELKSSKILIQYKRRRGTTTPYKCLFDDETPLAVIHPGATPASLCENKSASEIIDLDGDVLKLLECRPLDGDKPMTIDQFEDRAPLPVIHPDMAWDGATPASLCEKKSASEIIDLDGDDLKLPECRPLDGDEPIDQFEDGVPLRVIHPGATPASVGENSSASGIIDLDGDALKLLECRPLDGEEPKAINQFEKEAPLAVIHPGATPGRLGESSSASEIVDLNDEDEDISHVACGEGFSDSQHFDVASSSKGEVKLALIFNSSQRSDFFNTSSAEQMKVVEDKLRKSYRIMEPSFSLRKLLSEVCEHLSFGTVSGIDMKLRALECPKLSTTCGLEHKESRFYLDDITKGEERLKIPLVMGSTSAGLPGFTYTAQNLVSDRAHVKSRLCDVLDEDCCSQCFQDCLTSVIPCACARKNGGEFAYSQTGLIKDQFLKKCLPLHDKECCYFYCTDCPFERLKHNVTNSCKGHRVRKFIKECWAKCGCNRACGNRVVQRGITRNLQVFTTPEGKGWGLLTAESLPRGAFVCEYVGEIVTQSELEDRKLQNLDSQKHVDSVQLDAGWSVDKNFKDEEVLSLDAMNYGNAARFINHRCCDANLVEIPVEVETPDRHYYHFAFFTTRDVAAMEELTWDYGIETSKAFKCLCQSPFCRD